MERKSPELCSVYTCNLAQLGLTIISLWAAALLFLTNQKSPLMNRSGSGIDRLYLVPGTFIYEILARPRNTPGGKIFRKTI